MTTQSFLYNEADVLKTPAIMSIERPNFPTPLSAIAACEFTPTAQVVSASAALAFAQQAYDAGRGLQPSAPDVPITRLADYAGAPPHQCERGNWNLVLDALRMAHEQLPGSSWLSPYIQIALVGTQKPGIPGAFVTRRPAWRAALALAKEQAALYPDTHDPALWQRELDAFDAAFDRLWGLMGYDTPRDREADRARYPNPGFNEWLDDVVADGGCTVWHFIEDVDSAWAAWDVVNSRISYAEHDVRETIQQMKNYTAAFGPLDTVFGSVELVNLATALDNLDHMVRDTEMLLALKPVHVRASTAP